MGIWSPDFEWSKSGWVTWVTNGPNFKWDLKSVSPTILNPNKNVQIWNGSNYSQPLLMANHLKKKFEFCMVGFQIPTVIMHNIGLQRMTLKFFFQFTAVNVGALFRATNATKNLVFGLNLSNTPTLFIQMRENFTASFATLKSKLGQFSRY